MLVSTCNGIAAGCNEASCMTFVNVSVMGLMCPP
jgi:hypothetical protein